MRILIDIPEEDLKLLDLAVKRLSISRARFVRQAVAIALAPHRQKMNNDAFGSWAGHTEDGLEYQDRGRTEW
jgi:metal-responsive CopG/Arc/MetJ family transcriptional regulator